MHPRRRRLHATARHNGRAALRPEPGASAGYDEPKDAGEGARAVEFVLAGGWRWWRLVRTDFDYLSEEGEGRGKRI